jgi:hypothetical protein
MLPDAEDDGVPENGISLSDAFWQWCDISNPDWRQILDSYRDAHLPLDTDGLSNAELDQKRKEHRSTQKITEAELDRAERAAAYSMREALADGSLVALIRDPKTGDILKPSVWSDDKLQNYWRGRTHTDSSAPLESDFVSPDDPNAPGPRAQSNGRRRRVFFRLNDFQHWSDGFNKDSTSPTLFSPDDPKLRKSRFTREEIEPAYRKRIEEFRDKTPPSRKDDERWFKETFGIGRTRARGWREKLAPQEWKKRGRRKSGASN